MNSLFFLGEKLKAGIRRLLTKRTIKLSHPDYPRAINIIISRKAILIPTEPLLYDTFCINGRNDATVKCDLRGVKAPILLRAKTPDFAVLAQVFISRDYEIMFNIKPKLIIDAGAYTGISTVWFSSRYPKAQIIAIEPDSSNYEMLVKNTKVYPKIENINSAVWYKKCHLRIVDAKRGDWAFSVEEVDSYQHDTIGSITIEEILERSVQDKIDILKLDIEGAEKEIFSFGYEKWISKVEMIIIETHDRYKEGCSKAVFSVAEKYKFKVIRKGVKAILVKEVP